MAQISSETMLSGETDHGVTMSLCIVSDYQSRYKPVFVLYRNHEELARTGKQKEVAKWAASLRRDIDDRATIVAQASDDRRAGIIARWTRRCDLRAAQLAFAF